MSGSAIFSTFSRAPLAFDHGEGSWLVTDKGDRYLDFAAGIAVNSLGHAHPHLVEALTAQAGKLWHVANLYEIPEQERLARRLCEATFADRVFFGNSGAEALECAIKTARRYHHAKGAPQRHGIITFEGAFHGRTLATLAAGGQQKYLEGFGPKAQGFGQVAFGDVDAMAALVGDETAAILVEPVQGEGGVRPLEASVMRAIRELCDDNGLLLILDEVQSGVGRTGKFLAHEHSGIVPDIVALAKGLGGGFPVGACLATEDAASGMTAGTHGTTFGGNPLAMAVGNAVLDIMLADGFLEDVARKGALLTQGLASIADRYPDQVEFVRGVGLLAGLKCRVPNTAVNTAFREQNLLSVPAGDNVVRLLPPLTVTDEEIRLAVEKMDAALASLQV